MTMKNLIAFLFAIFTSLSFAESEPNAREKTMVVEGTLENTPKELLDYCKTVECRKGTHFKLKIKGGSYYEYSGFIDLPAIQPDILTIYPGEELYIEAEIDGDKLVNLKQVPTNVNPEKTISMKLWQEPSIRDGTEMMLSVTNPFKGYLRYEVGMMTLDSSNLKYTSSCPVMPGKISYEHWPFPIFQLAFANMRLIKVDGASITCQ
jgi:hypothetical protein